MVSVLEIKEGKVYENLQLFYRLLNGQYEYKYKHPDALWESFIVLNDLKTIKVKEVVQIVPFTDWKHGRWYKDKNDHYERKYTYDKDKKILYGSSGINDKHESLKSLNWIMRTEFAEVEDD